MKFEDMEYIENNVSKKVKDWVYENPSYLLECRDISIGDANSFGKASIPLKTYEMEVDGLDGNTSLDTIVEKSVVAIIRKINRVIFNAAESIDVSMELRDFKKCIKLVIEGDFICQERDNDFYISTRFGVGTILDI